MAYVAARFYYWLNSQHGWSSINTGIVFIAIVGPIMGIVL
jgi:branched-chain amino acid transport system permease protein